MFVRLAPRHPNITLYVSRSLPAPTDDSLNPAAHGSSSNPPSSLLLEEALVVVSPTKSLMDDTPAPHSLLPVLPPVTTQDGSLANVFVPLDAIKPSEFRVGAEPR